MTLAVRKIIEVSKAKKARQSKWQVFLKQFGESSGKCCTLSVT